MLSSPAGRRKIARFINMTPWNACPRRSSRNDDLADLPALLHVPMRVRYLAQRERAVNPGRELARFEFFKDIPYGDLQRLGIVGDREEGVTHHLEWLELCRPAPCLKHGEWRRFGRKIAVDQDQSILCGDLGELKQARPGNGVKDDLGPDAVRKVIDSRDDVLLLVGHDDIIRAGGNEFILLVRCTGGGDYRGSFRLRDLNGGDADGARGGRENDIVAFRHAPVMHKGAIGRDVLHPDAGSFFERQMRRVRGEYGSWNHGYFAINSVLVDIERRHG